jgi:tRNA G37 N-methylase Trm5
MSLAAAIAGVALVSSVARTSVEAQATPTKPLDVIYVPTPPTVVAKMLSMARVGPDDVVYDLGSGDGRIVIAAVKDFGAQRAVGYELDPVRLKEANENARAASVTDKVQFVAGDLFEADLSGATVITTYLLPVLNERLVPKFRTLKPGTRIVTHNYDLTDDWKPVERVVVEGHSVYFFRVLGR